MHDGQTIAVTRSAIRVLETASPPTFYIPREDVDLAALVESAGSSLCEWKGVAHYWSLRNDRSFGSQVGWSYEDPYPEFHPIRGYLSFYPSKLACYVGDVRAEAQAGGFYGGWITPDIVGPFKGVPGTRGW